MSRNSELFSACSDDHLHKRKTLRSINYIIGSFLRIVQLNLSICSYSSTLSFLYTSKNDIKPDLVSGLLCLPHPSRPSIAHQSGLSRNSLLCHYSIALLLYVCWSRKTDHTNISLQWFSCLIHSSKNDSLLLTNKSLLSINTPLPSRILSFAAFAMLLQRSLPTSARFSSPKVSHCPFSGSAC